MKKIIRFVLIALIMLNCIIIFNFSSENSNKSDKTSGRVINTLIQVNPITRNLNSNEKEIIKAKIDKPIRKTAHFTIYTSLGALVYLCILTFEVNKNNAILASLGLAFLYACTDEIHQLFVPGRSGQVTDVFIDSCGALFGISLTVLVNKITNRHDIQKNINKK